MKTAREKKKQERDVKKAALIQRLKKVFKDEHASNFIGVLCDNGYFQPMEESSVDGCLEDIENGETDLYLSLTNNGITVAIEQAGDTVLIGIDPAGCFDKITKCSIIACFPLSKREYEAFVKLFKKLNGEDTALRNTWLKEAPADFYGEYSTFGR